MSHYDFIVIGAGHNGLVCAAKLAATGSKVLVVERRDIPGGLCTGEEFHSGFTVPGFFHDTHGLSSQVVNELKLEQFGLKRQVAAPIHVMRPHGQSFSITAAGLSGASNDDVSAYQDWKSLVDSMRAIIHGIAHRAPPVMHPESTKDFFKLALTGLKLRALGKRRMVELLRITPMCIADWLNEFFPDRKVSEAIAAPSLLGSFLGPWSAGTAFNLLLTECLRDQEVVGGPAALTDVLVRACESAGVSIRLNAAVDQVIIERGHVNGVTLTGGEKIAAKTIVAAMDPKSLFLNLIEPRQLDVNIEKQACAIRTRGTLAKINLGFRGETGVDGNPSRIRLCTGDIDTLEKAFDAVKYGRFSETPLLDISIPSVHTPSLAPAGHHVLSVLVGYAPYELREGWSESTRHALAENVIDRIEKFVPGFRERIVCQEILVPPDIENRYGVHQGQVRHVEPALDQLLGMRPTISLAGYNTPVAGLHLCGSGSHPGGGVTGLPGLIAAGSINQ